MTTEEFSDEFDTLLNSYSSKYSFGESPNVVELDEYEKSLFLTSSQEEIVKELYSGKNSYGDSFESTEEMRRSLNNLIKTYKTSKEIEGNGVSSNSKFFSIPKDVWFITYESVVIQSKECNECNEYKEVTVYPVTQDTYSRTSNNPFRGAGKRRVLRLDNASDVIELISKYSIVEYLIRYLAKPTPIVLTNLDNLSINGVNIKTECSLSPIIHRYILERAVQKALISKNLLNNK